MNAERKAKRGMSVDREGYAGGKSQGERDSQYKRREELTGDGSQMSRSAAQPLLHHPRVSQECKQDLAVDRVTSQDPQASTVAVRNTALRTRLMLNGVLSLDLLEPLLRMADREQRH